jgi:hypothetical protein
VSENHNLPSQNLPSETLQQFIDNQTRELEIRSEELALKKQEDDHGFEFGKIALDAKIQDRAECRVHERKKTRDRYYFSGFIIIVLIAAILIALLNGHKDVAMELLKAIIYISAGALGGWGVAKRKLTTAEEDSNQN